MAKEWLDEIAKAERLFGRRCYSSMHSEHILIPALYKNNGKYACAIVALVSPGLDWSAYIGGADPRREEDAYHSVAANGSKLTEEQARFFFHGRLIDCQFSCTMGYRD